MSTYNNAATIQIGLGHLEKGRKLIEEAIVYGTNRGLPAHVDWSRGTRNEALFPMGEWDECLKVADDLAAEDARRGGSQVGTFANVTSALIRFFRGDTAASLAGLEEGLKAARAIQDPQALIPILSFVTMCLDWVGDGKRLRDVAEEFARTSRQHPVFLAGSIDLVAQGFRTVGLHDELSELIASAKAVGRRPLAQLNMARAALAEARGELEEALGILRSVISDCDGMAHRFLGTLARIDAARIASHLDESEEQTRLLDGAETQAASMGARRILDRIEKMRGEGRKATASGAHA